MGGGGSSSKQEQSTETNTTTTTTIRDIGLTGGAATDIAAIFQSGVIEQEQIIADTINNLIQAAGEGYNQLIGGAGLLVESGQEMSRTQQEAGLKAIEAGTIAAHPELYGELNLNKALPYIAVGIALFGIMIKK